MGAGGAGGGAAGFGGGGGDRGRPGAAPAAARRRARGLAGKHSSSQVRRWDMRTSLQGVHGLRCSVRQTKLGASLTAVICVSAPMLAVIAHRLAPPVSACTAFRGQFACDYVNNVVSGQQQRLQACRCAPHGAAGCIVFCATTHALSILLQEATCKGHACPLSGVSMDALHKALTLVGRRRHQGN